MIAIRKAKEEAELELIKATAYFPQMSQSLLFLSQLKATVALCLIFLSCNSSP